MVNRLYLVLRRDGFGAPTIHAFHHTEDEEFVRSGNAHAGDEVDVYDIPELPRRFRVEAANAPVKLVDR